MMESVTGSPAADTSRQTDITAASSCSTCGRSITGDDEAILRSHPVGGSADRSGVGEPGVRLVSPRSPVMAPAELRRVGHGPVQSLAGVDAMNWHCTHTEPALHFQCMQANRAD